MTPRFVFAALFALCALCTFDLTWAASVPKGFVSVKGSQFQLNGRPFVRILLITLTFLPNETFSAAELRRSQLLRPSEPLFLALQTP